MKNIVIIGSGVGGLTVAQTIRASDSESDITIVGAEDFYPYNRIKLSKSLEKDVTEDELLIKPKSWYLENNIMLLKGISMKSISSSEKKVYLSNGKSLKYDKLVLASGAKSFVPPVEGVDLKGVFSLRTLDDSWAIRDYMVNVQNVLVVGGGVLGLENAYSLAKQGKKVAVAEMADWLMPKQLDREASEILESKLRDAGVEIMFGASASKLLGGDSVESYETSDGKQHPAEMVIFSTGIRPNTDIEIDAELETNRGIVVNSKMETSVEDIYAVGDVAEFDGRVYGLWSISTLQAKVAAENILGIGSEFKDGSPMMSLNSFGLYLFSVGNISPENPDYTLTGDGPSYRKVVVKDSMPVGGIIFDDANKAIALKRMIEKGQAASREELEAFLK
ncbi:nitrite reductase [Andreesenia angusta]|uniref:Nitrite reductase n=1 Tax=Andreesenia angusta TaxID=39480 RepID=A0A1S1V5M9_9FIRM|nr:FAD-dependent oxidoreductase [Andreesenia angusta]OHW61824.1 nitrite reductase [Andreesenia angusta]